MIHALAKQYGCLPSKVLKNADTFDVLVLSVATSYEELQEAKASGKGIPKHLLPDNDILQEKLKRARNEK